MKNTVRINFEFPKEHYPYLKMLCAKKGLSLKQFATNLLVESIEDFEDRLLAEEAKKRIEASNSEDNVSFEEACKLLGIDYDQETRTVSTGVHKKSLKGPKKSKSKK